jgi:hypothetical protein
MGPTKVMGIANTVGRIGSGIIADLPCVDALWMNNVALMTGQLILMFPAAFRGLLGSYSLFLIWFIKM